MVFYLTESFKIKQEINNNKKMKKKTQSRNNYNNQSSVRSTVVALKWQTEDSRKINVEYQKNIYQKKIIE